MPAPRAPTTDSLRILSREPGNSASERLAHFLIRVFGDAATTCADPSLSAQAVEEVGQRLADAHLAFSGALWLERAHGVTRERFLRHKLVEAVIYTGETTATWVADDLRSISTAPTEENVCASMMALALTIFATYDFGRVVRFQKRGDERVLAEALQAVRFRRGRWPKLLALVKAMRLPRPKDADDLKNDVSRMRRLLSRANPPLYRVMPPVMFGFSLVVDG